MDLSKITRSRHLNAIIGLAAGVATFLATPTSANLRTVLGADRTGVGVAVFADTPTLITPVLGVATGTSVALGTNPAQSGAFRLANAATVSSRNAANTQDLVALSFDASNNLQIGANNAQANNTIINAHSALNIQLATGGVAKLTVANALTTSANPIDFSAGATTTGTLRMPATSGSVYMAVRNNANSANISAIAGNGTDTIQFGSTNLTTQVSGATVALFANAASKVVIGSSSVTSVDPIQIGTSPATTGAIGLANAAAINFRNGANSANLTLASTDSANNIFVGSSSSASLFLETGASSIFMRFSGTAAFTQTNALTTITTPLTTTKNAIAATSTDGLALDNTTVSTVGTTVQYSTRIRQRGHAWNSTSTLDETHDYAFEVRPVTAAGATSSAWALMRSLNGGAYSDVLKVGSDGSVSIGSAPAASGAVRLPAGGDVVNRNLGNTADLPLIKMSTGGNISVGGNIGGVGNCTFTIPTGGQHQFQINATAQLTIVSGLTTSANPIKFPTQSTPVTPAAGEGTLFYDGTNFKYVNAAGVTKTITAV